MRTNLEQKSSGFGSGKSRRTDSVRLDDRRRPPSDVGNVDHMTLFAGASRDEKIPVEVRRLGAGVGEVTCLECDGTGIWTVLPDDGPIRCTTCKGTGKVLISV
jgi:hypothetical protein